VGDLTDRGPDNIKCLELIKEDWFFPVLGNHEDLLMDTYIDGCVISRAIHYRNGGEWSGNIMPEKMIFYANQINNEVPLTISIDTPKGKVGISHAQPPVRDWDLCENSELKDNAIQTSLWARSLISLASEDEWECKNVALTIHGHTPVKKVSRVGNAIFIDRGSYYRELADNEDFGVEVFKIADLFNI